ncbi:MAG: chloride channel protein, partial [Spirochaetes bacterium]
MFYRLKEIFYFFKPPGAGKRVFFSIIIGIIAGAGAAAFFYLLEWGKFFAFEVLAGTHLTSPAGERLIHAVAHTPSRPWLWFIIPTVGGLLSGLIVYSFAPEAEGHGTDAMINAFHHLKGKIRTRVPYVKGIASIITLATGGSGGREGPIAQIGAGFGSWLGQILKLSPKEIRIMLLSGTAGGLGAIFRAPLGGAITSVEILYREDFETEAIIPCIISSVVAYTLYTFIFGNRPIFFTPKLAFSNPLELIFYAILGFVCAPVGYFYANFFYGIRDRFFKKIKIKPHFKPAIGGFLVGCIGYFAPKAMGGGYGTIQQAILGNLPLSIMATLVILKILTTSFTISSGGSGGVFGPSLFIGAMLGGTMGTVSHHFFPSIVTHPEAFVLVGMTGFFAGVAHAPLGSLLMVTEMTASYTLLAPLMLVSGISLLFTKKWSIYEKQVQNKFHSPAHAEDVTINVMQDILVRSIFKPQENGVVIIKENTPFSEIKKIIAESQHTYYPVVNEKNQLVGILSLNNIRTVMFDDAV